MSLYQADGAGFFDVRNHIVAIPQAGIPLHLVVEHEVTHVTLVRTSGLGVLEEAIGALHAWAYERNDAEALERLHTAQKALSDFTTAVHEAVAWYGSEELWRRDYTAEEIRLRPPLAFGPDIERLRQLLAPFEMSAMQRIEIVEALGTRALSGPGLVGVLAQTESLTLKAVVAALRADPPIRRFRALARWLIGQGWSVERIHEWSRWLARDPPMAGEEPAWTPMLTLGAEDAPLRLIGALAADLGVATGDATAQDLWRHYAAFWRMEVHGERYMQVAVLNVSPKAAVPPGEFVPALGRVFERPLVVVQGTSSRSWQPEIGRVFSDHDAVAFVSKPPFDRLPDTWSTAGRGEFRDALGDWPASSLVVVSSEGYDMSRGDYHDGLLGDIPHAVIAVMSFADLLRRLGNGLAARHTLEIMVVPSLVYPEYGFILVKPAEAHTPVVVSPTVTQLWRRFPSKVWTARGEGEGFEVGGTRIRPTRKTVQAWTDEDSLLRIVTVVGLIEGWGRHVGDGPQRALSMLGAVGVDAVPASVAERVLTEAARTLPFGQ